jgi:hypothetical protein
MYEYPVTQELKLWNRVNQAVTAGAGPASSIGLNFDVSDWRLLISNFENDGS